MHNNFSNISFALNINYNIMDLQTIKSKIPHGGYTEIVKLSGINKITICNFFNGKKAVTPKIENKILSATAKYLKGLQDQREKIAEQFKEIQ